MSARIEAVTVLLLGLISISCSSERRAESAPHVSTDILPAAASFAELFELVRTVTLEQPDSAVIARVSGLDITPGAGRILLGDASEANVKIFSANGRLLLTVGRLGKGPGEFGQPRFPRFASDGEIHIADAGNSSVTVLDSTGVYIRTVPLFAFSPIMGFQIDDSRNNYVLTAGFASDSTLYVVDDAGAVRRSYLANKRMKPHDHSDEAIWRTVTQHWLALAGESAYVANTVSDSLWTVDLATGAISAQRLVVPGYVAPSFPESPPRGPRELIAWQAQFHIAAAIWVDGRRVVLPFVRGVLNYGDPMTLVVRDSGGSWWAVADAPIPLLARHGLFVSLLTPNEDAVQLGVYRWRR